MLDNYDDALKQVTVQKFVEENNRTPNLLELRRELLRARRRYPSLEEVGFAGHLITKPQFTSVSSASEENKNRRAVLLDAEIASQRTDHLWRALENTFRGTQGNLQMMKRKLHELESRVDNLLLLSGNTDIFVYGIEEDFVTQDKVDFSQTDASVEAGFVTIGRAGFGLVDMDQVRITHSTSAERGYIGSQNSSAISSLKEDDGEFWEHLVYTNYQQGRVTVTVDATLDVPQYVSEFRFTGVTSGLNSRVVATAFFSLDGRTFKACEPQEVTLGPTETCFNIGEDGVQKIRLMLSKEQFDNTTTVSGQYVYLFSLDSLKIYSRNYSTSAESTYVSGPYNIYDETGQEILFTKATCDVCVSQGEESAVSVYLSTDGVDWNSGAGSTDHGSAGIFSFADGTSTGAIVQLDASKALYALVESLSLVDLDLAHESLLNTAIPAEHATNVVRKTAKVKRNIVIEGTEDIVLGAVQGWGYNRSTSMYRTTAYVTNPAGMSIDLGHTSAFVNGLQSTGLVTLKQGYNVFETNASNWGEIPVGLYTLQDVRKEDPLYPYNHKYLLEGYPYADTFNGERVYLGVEEYFGELLTYVPPEIFASPDNATNYTIFTIDDTMDIPVFKVKVNKQDGTWANEKFSVDWTTNKRGSDTLWLKMILSSSTDYTSPVVTSIKVRVV